MAEFEKAIADVLEQIMSEYGGRIKMNGNSKVLVSDANVAKAIHKATEDVRTPNGPHITIAKRGLQGEDAAQVEGVATYQAVEQLETDHFSHAIFGVAGEDPKFIMQGMRAMINSMAPKGVAVVIALRTESGQSGEDGQVSVSLEDKMKYQSKGRIEKLSDVLEYAGFEKGKIKSIDKSTEVDGKKSDAEVVLAMKWDQLTG